MELVIETAVSQVTVYPDRARVTVEGVSTVEAGTLRLVVEELPLVLEPESVRVTGKGTAKVRILGVDVTRSYYVDTPSAKVQDLEQQIELVEGELRVVQDEKSGWQSRAKYLEGLREATAEFARGLARGRIDVAQQGELLGFMHEEGEQLRAALRTLDQQQRDLTKRLEKLRLELKGLQSARPRQRFQARIDAEAMSAGEFELSLSYVVQKAGWRPLYDIRLQTGGEAPLLTISTLAQVFQNTGQDWPGVALTVSTARPALTQRLPELKPWFIDELRVMPPPAPMAQKRVLAAAPARAEMTTMAVADAEPEPIYEEAEVAVAEVQTGETAVTFKVGGSVDIPGDGSPHKTTLNQFDPAPKIDYLTVPKHTDAVFRRATLMNSGPSPLLAGAASLFVDEEYIGQTHLDYVPKSGELELLLGVEERVTIERELTRREVDKRLLKDNRQLRYGYKLTAKNLLSTSVELEVHDHIPVPRHEQIKVKLESVQPPPTEKSDLNLMEWHLTISAGAEQTILYEYLVEHPRAIRVAGLID